MTGNTNQIEKKIVLGASVNRVWQALSDAKQFGAWFGAEFEGSFVVGTRVDGKIAPTRVDPEVARMQAPFEGKSIYIWIERMEPEKVLAFRWHPYEPEPGVDIANVPTTLVTFALRSVSHGTELTITESGFDQIPIERRAQAFADNEGGWTIQATLIDKYLTQHP